MFNDDKSRRPNLQIYSFFPQLLFQLAPLGPQERPGRCAGGSAMIAIQKAVSSNSVDEALGGIATKLAILTNVGVRWTDESTILLFGSRSALLVKCSSAYCDWKISVLYLTDLIFLTNIARRILDLLCVCFLTIHLQYQPIALKLVFIYSAHIE